MGEDNAMMSIFENSAAGHIEKVLFFLHSFLFFLIRMNACPFLSVLSSASFLDFSTQLSIYLYVNTKNNSTNNFFSFTNMALQNSCFYLTRLHI